MAQRKQILLGTMRLWVRSVALLNGLRIWRCYKLWCRLQIWLRSHVAVAVTQASSCSSDLTSSLGTSICHGYDPKKQKKKKKKKDWLENPEPGWRPQSLEGKGFRCFHFSCYHHHLGFWCKKTDLCLSNSLAL